MAQMTDITIHIDETLDPARMESLRDILLNDNGVMTADYRRENLHLMVVGYDPQATSSQTLLRTVQAQDMHAELIGM